MSYRMLPFMLPPRVIEVVNTEPTAVSIMSKVSHSLRMTHLTLSVICTTEEENVVLTLTSQTRNINFRYWKIGDHMGCGRMLHCWVFYSVKCTTC